MTRPARGVALVLAMLAGLAQPAAAEPGEEVARIGQAAKVTVVAEGLEFPWSLAFLPDGAMLVTERDGRLRRVTSSGVVSEPIAGVPEVYDRGQGGLLDVVLSPTFAEDRRIYLSFAEEGDGGAGTAVARATLGDSSLSDVEVIYRQVPKVRGSNHWGSRLVFAPDGRLFISQGDRQQRDEAQNTASGLGKLMRVNTDGSPPADNPFAGQAGILPEIWSLGHRNIQGAALHPDTGQIWTVEHGARGGDEINVPKAGRNYGWPVITYGVDYSGARIGEGTAKDGLEQPVHYWDPSIAPSGMMFYTGDAFPQWKGNLFVGSLKFGLLVRLGVEGERITGEERYLEDLGTRIRDVRQGPDGFIYLLTDTGDDSILRVEPL
ncbi:PQQ-dependent sugar dehydrogenase [Zavarzinia sp. CC-PAN008]|uniref:PQQ-dependent sugar dehydrogenase n=1 Tax=Zavarzinia sp. CC-PAN008 TaxID=3243332 RepID=UPI003F748BD5